MMPFSGWIRILIIANSVNPSIRQRPNVCWTKENLSPTMEKRMTNNDIFYARQFQNLCPKVSKSLPDRVKIYVRCLQSPCLHSNYTTYNHLHVPKSMHTFFSTALKTWYPGIGFFKFTSEFCIYICFLLGIFLQINLHETIDFKDNLKKIYADIHISPIHYL